MVDANGLTQFPHSYKFSSGIISELHAAHNKIRRVGDVINADSGIKNIDSDLCHGMYGECTLLTVYMYMYM